MKSTWWKLKWLKSNLAKSACSVQSINAPYDIRPGNKYDLFHRFLASTQQMQNYRTGWHSEECKLTPTLMFDLLTSNKMDDQDLSMYYYPPVTFGDDMSSGFCFRMLTYTRTNALLPRVRRVRNWIYSRLPLSRSSSRLRDAYTRHNCWLHQHPHRTRQMLFFWLVIYT